MDCNVVISDYLLRLAVVYRPPQHKNGLKTTVFLEQELSEFLVKYATIDKNIIITGDLNFILTFHQIGTLLSSKVFYNPVACRLISLDIRWML